MKLATWAYSILFFLLYAFSIHTLVAQEDRDPFLGNYILANEAELLLMTGDLLRTIDLDLEQGNQSEESRGFDPLYETQPNDICVGDFDNDGDDEAVTAMATITDLTGSPYLYLITDNEEKEIGIVSYTYYGQPILRLVTGEFDGDVEKEFVLAYWGIDSTIHINLYEIDSNLKVRELASSNTAVLDPSLKEEVLFDITVGDFVKDGLDEIILVKNNGPIYIHPEIYYEAHIDFILNILKYDPSSNGLFQIGHKNITRIHPVNGSVNKLKRLAVASGQLAEDRRDEFVVGYSFTTIEDMSALAWETSLLPFKVQDSTMFDLKIVDVLDEAALETDYIGVDGQFTKTFSNFDNMALNAPLTMVCSDINNDYRDEIFCSGGEKITIYFATDDLHLDDPPMSVNYNPYVFDDQGHRAFTVVDLDADTMAVQLNDSTTSWTPELVVVDYATNWAEQTSADRQLRISVFNFITLDGYPPAEIDPKGQWTPDGYSSNYFNIAAGDVDGNALRLGQPRIKDEYEVIQPAVILNAPPVHFDVLDSTYDVCKAFNDYTSEFFAEYITEGNTEKIIETEFHRDWGLSASLTSKFIVAGSGIKGRLAGNYGNGFSKVDAEAEVISVSVSAKADLDDSIYAYTTKYKLWEYPVYYRKELLGYVLVADPTEAQKSIWSEGRGWNYPAYVPNHEVGNIFSYTPRRDTPVNLQIDTFSESFSISANSEYGMTVAVSNITSGEVTKSSEFGLAFDLLTKIGYEGEVSAEVSAQPFGVGVAVGESHGVEIGIEIETGVFYDQKEIQTHRTIISDTWQLNVALGSADGSLGGVEYVVSPYVYWTHNGTLVLDYEVEPTGNWWDYHYGDKPDLALILPKRYHTEKGDDFTPGYEYERYETKDMHISPARPAPGDTVEMITRVHNYSLAAIPPDDTVRIRYYIGDPDDGGQPLPDIVREGRTWKWDIKQPLSETYFYVQWVIPTDIVPESRIYAVLDPDSLIDEIHVNNNKGYIVLPLKSVTSIASEELLTIPQGFQLFNNYPNPFNPTTRIRFALPSTEIVKLVIYNSLGQKVQTLLNEKKSAGVHEVEFSAAELASGLYFYQLSAGKYVNVQKMMIIK